MGGAATLTVKTRDASWPAITLLPVGLDAIGHLDLFCCCLSGESSEASLPHITSHVTSSSDQLKLRFCVELLDSTVL